MDRGAGQPDSATGQLRTATGYATLCGAARRSAEEPHITGRPTRRAVNPARRDSQSVPRVLNAPRLRRPVNAGARRAEGKGAALGDRLTQRQPPGAGDHSRGPAQDAGTCSQYRVTARSSANRRSGGVTRPLPQHSSGRRCARALVLSLVPWTRSRRLMFPTRTGASPHARLPSPPTRSDRPRERRTRRSARGYGRSSGGRREKRPPRDGK
ncbi:hypothetical protein AOLI_G00306720 [Acnodon oligacanthus]